MKKLLILLTGSLILSLSACNSGSGTNNGSSDENQQLNYLPQGTYTLSFQNLSTGCGSGIDLGGTQFVSDGQGSFYPESMPAMNFPLKLTNNPCMELNNSGSSLNWSNCSYSSNDQVFTAQFSAEDNAGHSCQANLSANKNN